MFTYEAGHLRTIDRDLGIVHALKYCMFMTSKRIILEIASSWVFPAMLPFLTSIRYEQVSTEVQDQTKPRSTRQL